VGILVERCDEKAKKALPARRNPPLFCLNNPFAINRLPDKR
jgi:hypothetical protein